MGIFRDERDVGRSWKRVEKVGQGRNVGRRLVGRKKRGCRLLTDGSMYQLQLLVFKNNYTLFINLVFICLY